MSTPYLFIYFTFVFYNLRTALETIRASSVANTPTPYTIRLDSRLRVAALLVFPASVDSTEPKLRGAQSPIYHIRKLLAWFVSNHVAVPSNT
jgi:hypothetical protein